MSGSAPWWSKPILSIGLGLLSAFAATVLPAQLQTAAFAIGATLTILGIALIVYHWRPTHLTSSLSPLEIEFDPANPGRKFFSIEPNRDNVGKPTQGSYWEYRALVRNRSPKTLKNVKVTVEAIGALPTRPEPSYFDINKKPAIDLTPSEEVLAVVRRWFNPPIVVGMVIGEDAYGPIRMVASADDVPPTIKLFQFDPSRTPMIYEVCGDLRYR